jgi:hypothetical protein
MRQTVQSTVLEFGSENKCKNQRKTDKTPKPKMSNQADEKNGSQKKQPTSNILMKTNWF